METKEISTNPFEVLNQRLSNIEKLLSDSNKCQVEKEPLSRFITMEELMKIHPAHPTKKTIYQWTHIKKIPFKKSGRKLIFLRSEIEKFIEETCK